MTTIECTNCSEVELLEWNDDGWQRRLSSIKGLQPSADRSWAPFSNGDNNICIIMAKAKEMRKCERCRAVFSDALSMPDLWWENHYKRLNGYFECEVINRGYNSYAFFEIKTIKDSHDYTWRKINLFARWLPKRKQTIVVLFDIRPGVLQYTLKPLSNEDVNRLEDPYWIYSRVAADVAWLGERSTWDIRNLIREAEKKPILRETQYGKLEFQDNRPHTVDKPLPVYSRLEDNARHAAHVSETLDVCAQTLQRIIYEHDKLFRLDAEPMALLGHPLRRIAHQDSEGETPSLSVGVDTITAWNVGQSLQSSQGILKNLRYRSEANMMRLQAGIQLSLNSIARYEAGESAKMAEAMREDSMAMRTVAYMTLTFLPATFVASIFSMSFFKFDPGEGEGAVSGRFWVYWAVALPLTVLTIGVYLLWFEGEKLMEHRMKRKPRMDSRKNEELEMKTL